MSKSLIRSRLVLVLIGLALTMSVAYAQGLSVSVSLKTPDGKPALGKEVKLERKDAKAPASVATTDAKGHVVFNKLALGTYEVSALENHAAVSSAVVKTKRDGIVSVNLKAGSVAAAATPAKKKKKYIYSSQETGSHIGGGRWIEVPDNDAWAPVASNSGASPVDIISREVDNGQQSFQPRPGNVWGF
jgi:hypothetical protein